MKKIDFATDLARARKDVWPAIKGGAYQRRRLRRTAAWTLGIGLLAAALFIGPMLPRPGAEPPTEWESFPMGELEPVRVDLGEYSQQWWLLDEGAYAHIEVPPGGRVRVESRLLDPASDTEPYVLELLFDEELLDWFKLTTRPSGTAKHPKWVVGHKKRFKVDVPEAAEELQVRLVAPRDGRCLIRVRQLLSDVED